VGANLGGFQTLGAKLVSIALTDAGTPGLTVKASLLPTYASTLAKISGPYAILPSGVIGASAAMGLPASLLSRLAIGLAISDTSSSVVANLNALQAATVAGQISSIALTTGPTSILSIQAPQLALDAQALGLITGAFMIKAYGPITVQAALSVSAGFLSKLTVGLTVYDIGANISAALDGLQALIASGHLAAINLTDSVAPVLSITATQLVADASALTMIKGAYTLTVSGVVTAAVAAGVSSVLLSKVTSAFAVVDTGANVSTNLAKLETLAVSGRLSSITLTDGVLKVTASQFTGDAAAIGKVIGPATLVLQGAGAFNLGAIASLPTLTTLTVYEGQAASGAIASTLQTVTLRSGAATTVNVQGPVAFNTANLNPASVSIVGSNDADVINLGAGADTVKLGSASEVVNGGSGAATVNAAAATAGALLNGGSGGLALVVSGGGVVALNSADTGVTKVTLLAASSAYSLSTGGESGLAITDQSSNPDTINFGGSGQSATGGKAGKLGVAFSNAGGDTFRNTTSTLNGDSVSNFLPANGDAIDVTDLNATAAASHSTFKENAAGTQGTLTISDGVHSASVILFGQIAAAGFSGSAASAGFAFAPDTPASPNLGVLITKSY
jgi:hypothetical protein